MKVKKPSMLRRLEGKQKGFTLLELLLVIALTGIITAAASMAIHQVLTGTTLGNDLNTAVNQVRTASYWIERDALMAQTVVAVAPGSPLILTWTDSSGADHEITYTLVDVSGSELKELWRDFDGQQAVIAQYIKPTQTGVPDCYWDGEVLTGNVTAQVGDETETRTFQVKPRPLD